ncbi:MAG: class I SAM-dependent methyltransferase [Clostridium sp.]|nr:class I SAM-dependent methyltransferase [Clostridium sp.]
MLERMEEFFNNRAETYEEHMMNNVVGADKYYAETAKLIPKDRGVEILDLGCGTGLEIDEILKINPDVNITAIDMAENMVQKIKEKHVDKMNQINIIVDNYLNYNFGNGEFDAVVSVESLHHFSHEEKIKLYTKIYNALNRSGIFIDTDYVAPDQEFEDYHYKENAKIRLESGINSGLYHYDTPCTVENEKKFLLKSGFKHVEDVWKKGDTAIIVAKK